MSKFVFKGNISDFDVFLENETVSREQLDIIAQDSVVTAVKNFPQSIMSKIYQDLNLVKPLAKQTEEGVVYDSDLTLIRTKEEIKDLGFEESNDLVENLNSAQLTQVLSYMASQSNSGELFAEHQSNIKKSLEEKKLLLDCDTPNTDKPYLLRIYINKSDYLAKIFSSESDIQHDLSLARDKGIDDLQRMGFGYISTSIVNT